MAKRYEITETVQRVTDGYLAPGDNASALVKDLSGSTLTVYSGETGVGTVSNPVTTTSFGRIEGWVEVPDYDIDVSGAGITSYTQNVRMAPQGTIGVVGSDKINWAASGSLTSDTNLYRSAADILKTDDAFHAVGQIIGSVGTNQVQLGAVGPSSAAGLLLGTAADTNLYRSAANTLKTDDVFDAGPLGIVLGGSRSSTPSNQINQSNPADGFTYDGRFLGYYSMGFHQGTADAFAYMSYFGTVAFFSFGSMRMRIGGTGGENRIDLVANNTELRWGDGSTYDTNLYRTAANTLKTDDSFHVGSDLRHLGSNLGFFNVTAVARQGATTDIKDALTNYGLLQGTSASPLNLDGGTLTAGQATITGALDHDGTTVGFYTRTPTVINATPFTNGAGVGTSQYDLPAGFTLNQLAALVMTALKHMGDVNGVGLVNTTGV